MSLTDDLADLIHDDGPKSRQQIQATFPGWSPQQVGNAIIRACQKHRIHNCAGPGLEAVYKFGPAPDWLPDPLPVNSIWQHAERCAPKGLALAQFFGGTT